MPSNAYQESLCPFSLEGKDLEVVTAEGLLPGDIIVQTGPKAGIQNLFQVLESPVPTENEMFGEVVIPVETQYDGADTLYHAGDVLMIRVKRTNS